MAKHYGATDLIDPMQDDVMTWARDLTGGFTVPMVGAFLAAVAGLLFVALAQRVPAPPESVAAEG